MITYSNGSVDKSRLKFADRFRLSNSTFILKNLVFDNTNNSTLWRNVGVIQGENWDFNSIIWPGHTLFGPLGISKPVYRVVTRPASPFVMIHGPVTERQHCYADVPCLQVFTYDKDDIINIIEHYLEWSTHPNLNYDIYCCSGMTIELLKEISRELGFDYVIYFQNDTDYGSVVNGTVSGLVGNVVSGSADIIASAFSVTRERMEHVSFTKPFYYSGFSMISRGRLFSPSPTAFLKPFSTEVWLCIFLSGLITAIATSLLEWNSPYGLNPWGRNRHRNYTLGSGMVMVYSVLFGHTVSTKSPKSWPSKVLQNFWAGLAIFIIASYTANLAAYLAGRTTVVEIHNISEVRLQNISDVRSHNIRKLKIRISELGKNN